MIIFLDFDGVLHPVHARDSGQFCYMEDFLDLVDDFPKIEIVISSSWRHQMSLDTLQSMFGRHARKVIDATPDVKAPVKNDFWRLYEIETWIAENDYKGSWIAIDDAANEFPFEHPDLFLCESSIGLDDDAIEALRLRLMGMMK